MTNEPIEPQNYLHGVNVVDFGDVRVSRGKTRREFSGCGHKKLNYDQMERRIWCSDCEKDVDPFDALMLMLEHYDSACKHLEEKSKRIMEASEFRCRSLAAKNIDEVWRRRKVVPVCPHCKHGLFPEYFAQKVAVTGREYALKRLGKSIIDFP
jgi:hypothetical protein